MVAARRLLVVAVALGLAAAPAGAHVGASVAKANYLHPAPPIETLPDGGAQMIFSYTPEDADASYHFDWIDGDVDPTGKFTFYYLDHGVSDAVSANDIEMIATHVVDVKGRSAINIYTSCTCALDAGVICPDLGDGGVRWCDNFVDWDTSAVPNGTYWLAAVNNDPPFHVYNLSYAPVRVFHQKKPPPAVLVERPDGLGHASRTYHIGVIVVGTGTLKLDSAWGDNLDETTVLGPVHTIANDVPIQIGADGLTGYDWDVSALPNDPYFVRATLTDDNGQVYSDSRFALSVYHDPDGGAEPTDLSIPATDDADVLKLPPAPTGCACALGTARSNDQSLAVVLLLLAAVLRTIGRKRSG